MYIKDKWDGVFSFPKENRDWRVCGPQLNYPSWQSSSKGGSPPRGHCAHTHQSRPLPQSQSRQDIPPRNTGHSEAGALLCGRFYLNSQDPRWLPRGKHGCFWCGKDSVETLRSLKRGCPVESLKDQASVLCCFLYCHWLSCIHWNLSFISYLRHPKVYDQPSHVYPTWFLSTWMILSELQKCS